MSHTHTFTGSQTSSSGSHNHALWSCDDWTADAHGLKWYDAGGWICSLKVTASGSRGSGEGWCYSSNGKTCVSTEGSHTHTISGTISNSGIDGKDMNLPQSLVVTIWKRTA